MTMMAWWSLGWNFYDQAGIFYMRTWASELPVPCPLAPVAGSLPCRRLMCGLGLQVVPHLVVTCDLLVVLLRCFVHIFLEHFIVMGGPPNLCHLVNQK